MALPAPLSHTSIPQDSFRSESDPVSPLGHGDSLCPGGSLYKGAELPSLAFTPFYPGPAWPPSGPAPELVQSCWPTCPPGMLPASRDSPDHCHSPAEPVQVLWQPAGSCCGRAVTALPWAVPALSTVMLGRLATGQSPTGSHSHLPQQTNRAPPQEQGPVDLGDQPPCPT